MMPDVLSVLGCSQIDAKSLNCFKPDTPIGRFDYEFHYSGNLKGICGRLILPGLRFDNSNASALAPDRPRRA